MDMTALTDLRLDYFLAALGGGVVALTLERLLTSAVRFWRRQRLWFYRQSSQSRSLLSVALLVGLFSIFQFYQTGRIHWPEDLFYTSYDLVSQFGADSSEASGSIPEANDISTLTGRVVEVIDGDSIRVRGSSAEVFEIRLYGIDTPEWDQPHGNRAERALARKIRSRRVNIEITDVDSYGRLVGTVYHEDDNINLEMVEEGHAWWYRDFARGASELEDAEDSAQSLGLGLWSRANPVPPWQWRRR